MRTIIIVCRDSNDFNVHDGEQFADRLTWDEMLGTVARLTHPVMREASTQIPPYRMETLEAMREQASDLRRRIRELAEQLPKSEDDIPI